MSRTRRMPRTNPTLLMRLVAIAKSRFRKSATRPARKNALPLFIRGGTQFAKFAKYWAPPIPRRRRPARFEKNLAKLL